MNIPEHVKAEFKIIFESVHVAEVVLRSIGPEIQTSPSQKSSVEVNLEGNNLNLILDAEDTPSLRASVNSYLRWIILSAEVNQLKKGREDIK